MALNKTSLGARDLQHPSTHPSMSIEPIAVLLKEEIWQTYQSHCQNFSREYDELPMNLEQWLKGAREDCNRFEQWFDALFGANPNQPWWVHSKVTIDNAVDLLLEDVEKEIDDESEAEIKALVNTIMTDRRAIEGQFVA